MSYLVYSSVWINEVVNLPMHHVVRPQAELIPGNTTTKISALRQAASKVQIAMSHTTTCLDSRTDPACVSNKHITPMCNSPLEHVCGRLGVTFILFCPFYRAPTLTSHPVRNYSSKLHSPQTGPESPTRPHRSGPRYPRVLAGFLESSEVKAVDLKSQSYDDRARRLRWPHRCGHSEARGARASRAQPRVQIPTSGTARRVN